MRCNMPNPYANSRMCLEFRPVRPGSTGCGKPLRSNSLRFQRHKPMRDLSAVKQGWTGSARITVGAEHTAPRVGSGRVHVLATPVMINLMEAAALDAIEALLPAGHQSLGTRLDVRHIAATPVGMKIFASARVTRVEGRTIAFEVAV